MYTYIYIAICILILYMHIHALTNVNAYVHNMQRKEEGVGLFRYMEIFEVCTWVLWGVQNLHEVSKRSKQLRG